VTNTKAPSRPPLIISHADAERLTHLALRHEASDPTVSELLLDELARAQVRPEARIPADVAGMESVVEFVDEAHARSRTVQLVYPVDADIGAGRVSVMTPIGAGLIGLRAGQSILWPDRGGGRRALRIVRVERHAAPAAGA